MKVDFRKENIIKASEVEMLYNDIVFSHFEYSYIIFDSMYELVLKTIGKKRKSDDELASYGLTNQYLYDLKHKADTSRHSMKLKGYIEDHNKLLSGFNSFLVKAHQLKTIKEYRVEKYEQCSEDLALYKVINEINIIKLYEQFMILFLLKNKRSILRLQMFFESSIRHFFSISKKQNFQEIITDSRLMKEFVDYIYDFSVSKSQVDIFIKELMKLNEIRNKIKKSSDYRFEINIENLEKYAMLTAKKLEEVIAKCDKVIFGSKQSLLEFRNAFRELSFDYRYSVYDRLKEDLIFDQEVKTEFQSDIAFKLVYVNSVMEELKMKSIKDFSKMMGNINEFEKTVNELAQITQKYSDVKDKFDAICTDAIQFRKINQKLSKLDEIDFDKLENLLKAQLSFPNKGEYAEALNDLKDNLRYIKDSGKAITRIKKAIEALEEKVATVTNREV